MSSEQPEGSEPRSFYDAPKAGDEVRQAFNEDVPAHYAYDPKDGMPLPVIDEATLDVAQPRPLARETLVCMADTSEFVLRDPEWRTIVARIARSHVTRLHDGTWVARTDVVAEQLGGKPRWKFWQTAAEWVASVARGVRVDEEWCVVEPLRPQCTYYTRQLIDHPGDPEHKQVVRLCTARRVDYGDFLSLTDDRMHACELRSPRWVSADAVIDAIDEEKIELAKKAAEEDNVWDVDAALAGEEQDADYSVLGPGADNMTERNDEHA